MSQELPLRTKSTKIRKQIFFLTAAGCYRLLTKHLISVMLQGQIIQPGKVVAQLILEIISTIGLGFMNLLFTSINGILQFLVFIQTLYYLSSS